MTTGALAMVRCLELEGVKTAFGYPGAAIRPFYDAAGGQLRFTMCWYAPNRTPAHAASGYARISGEPGVCIATSGPGATNLLTGIATAYMDCIPLVVHHRPGAQRPAGPRRVPGGGYHRRRRAVHQAQLHRVPGVGIPSPGFQGGVSYRLHTAGPARCSIDVPIDMQQKSIRRL